ncbi:lytic transglycosylase [Christiangramia fulva]|uniref:Lytic transglycosylase n=1 Tax=Christiangramia fulva TaxID=2126553 RepID=A0A2R3Z3K8_9FLAO|nr:LysM peptidoglycan-binding domain-containing protein [Christiangramia fulva]AVR44845.1 lytic transglycosylase [Christiangramia fulva]
MLKQSLCIVFLLAGISIFAQEKKNNERLEKANFRVQIFKKTNNSEIKLAKPDPEFRDKLPISAQIGDSSRIVLKDLPRAASIDSLWRKELTNSDLFERMQRNIQDQDYEEVVYDALPTDTLKARLAKLNARTPFNIEYNPILESVIKSYLKRDKQNLERLMALSTYYFPLFEQELDKYDIPLEIKYLAIIESALNPRAKSRVGATGLWQFMFTTGKMHGLDVSSYVDERMDPARATEAAAEYLASLYKVFGDWDLVLASYNSGPGNVSKAIRRSGGSTDYWTLRRYLPRETAGYVPAFLATLYLFEYAQEHHFQPKNPDIVFFETDTIQVKQLLTFDQISKVTGVDKSMLEFLNPSYKLDIIPYVEDEKYVVRLPRPATGKFVNNEDAIYNFAEKDLANSEKELPKYVETEDRIRYRVKPGDYLGRIAERYGVGVSSLRNWNNLRSNNIRVGQYLTIYPRKPVTGQVASGNQKSSNKSDPKTYTVKQGDSLWSISRKFPGVTVQNLQSWNDVNSNSLKPGMKLKVSRG